MFIREKEGLEDLLRASALIPICLENVPAKKSVPGIKKIYFNKKHTTIEWVDGTKTTVGCIAGQEFDEYGGFTAAIVKRMFGSSSAAIRFMNEHKEVQPEPTKKIKKTVSEQVSETAVMQDA